MTLLMSYRVRPPHRFSQDCVSLWCDTRWPWRAPFMLTGAAVGAESGSTIPVRVGVYDVEPYGGQGPEGLFDGASVDLWRRVAEHLNWQYQLTLVSQMSDLLAGLENGTYDVAIGAITITPERLARVDFSYPT